MKLLIVRILKRDYSEEQLSKITHYAIMRGFSVADVYDRSMPDSHKDYMHDSVAKVAQLSRYISRTYNGN